VQSFLSSIKFVGALSPWQWALAAAVPVGIVALYFLKLKRKPLVVPSTFLWKKSIEDLHVNSFWQRLRKNILLLLQLLVATAAIFALLNPTANTVESGKRYVIALDNSASMSAIDDGVDRLQAAKRKATEFIDSLSGNDDLQVLAFNDAARTVSTFSRNPNAVKNAIQSIGPTSRRTNLHEAFTIASGLANPLTGGELGKEIFTEAQPATLVVVSDGRFPKMPHVTLGRLDVKYVGVGKPGDNLAITRLSARRSPSEPDKVDLFGMVQNFSTAARTATAKLTINGRAADLQRLTVNPGDEASFLFRLKLGEAAVLGVDLGVEDALALDNVAWAVVEPPRKARVAVVGDKNLILQTAFASKALAEVAEVEFLPKETADRDLSEDQKFRGFDLAIFDRCAPKGMPNCNSILMGAVPPSLSEGARNDVKAPAILNWNVDHPVMRYLVLDDVFILEAFTLPEVKGANALVETNHGAIMFTMPRGVFTDLVMTFKLIDDNGEPKTDWPGKPSFPLFLMNALQTMSGVENETKQNLQPGDSIVFRAHEGITEATVAMPGGAKRTVKRSKTGTFEFLDTDDVGIYEVAYGDIVRRFAVNLFDAEESKIAPSESLTVGQEQVTADVGSFIRRRELWKWLALVALALVLFEWYVYNRRVHI
jgi:hypothetical protein